MLTFPRKTITIKITLTANFKEVFHHENSTDFFKFYRQSEIIVNAITQYEYDFDLISGRYVIDAKSIMGIFSLDLSKPIDLAIHAEANVDEIMETLKPYLI